VPVTDARTACAALVLRAHSAFLQPVSHLLTTRIPLTLPRSVPYHRILRYTGYLPPATYLPPHRLPHGSRFFGSACGSIFCATYACIFVRTDGYRTHTLTYLTAHLASVLLPPGYTVCTALTLHILSYPAFAIPAALHLRFTSFSVGTPVVVPAVRYTNATACTATLYTCVLRFGATTLRAPAASTLPYPLLRHTAEFCALHGLPAVLFGSQHARDAGTPHFLRLLRDRYRTAPRHICCRLRGCAHYHVLLPLYAAFIAYTAVVLTLSVLRCWFFLHTVFTAPITHMPLPPPPLTARCTTHLYMTFRFTLLPPPRTLYTPLVRTPTCRCARATPILPLHTLHTTHITRFTCLLPLYTCTPHSYYTPRGLHNAVALPPHLRFLLVILFYLCGSRPAFLPATPFSTFCSIVIPVLPPFYIYR